MFLEPAEVAIQLRTGTEVIQLGLNMNRVVLHGLAQLSVRVITGSDGLLWHHNQSVE